jgi:uncharacterized protein (DUF2336 family)
MLDSAAHPRDGEGMHASAVPVIDPLSFEEDPNSRKPITALSFRVLQEKLRITAPRRTSSFAAALPVIPELFFEPEPEPAPQYESESIPPVEPRAEELEPLLVPAEEAEEAGQAAPPLGESFAEPLPPEPPIEAEPEPEEDILRPLVEKFSGTAALLKKIEPDLDPFSETPSELAQESAAFEPDPYVDPLSGDLARSLLDVMSAPSGASQPQERALAADTLLRLVPRLPFRSLIGLVERVSYMEHPPQLLIRRLIRDPRIEVAGPLLEGASAISDQDLLAVIAEGDPSKQRLIARRRTLSPAVSTALIDTGDAGALLTLVRNPGASFSIESFHELGALAAAMPALQAPLATRLDTPAPVAFELFWALPAELRRYVLSRFLTDSEVLDRILKIALTVGTEDVPDGADADAKFPEKSAVDAFVELALGTDPGLAGEHLADIAGISRANADRIIADREGEPISVVLKALGVSRARFAEVMTAFTEAPEPLVRSDRNIADLQSIFDSLSFNKARMLLTYWDWAAQNSGPYARSIK